MSIRLSCLLLALFAVFAAAPCAVAEDGLPTISTEPDFMLTAPTNVSKDLRLEAAVGHVGEADFSNNLGSVAVTRGMLAADYSIFKLSYVLSHFDWMEKANVARTLRANNAGQVPWSDLHDVTLQARFLNNKIGDNWRYWVNGELTSSFEEDFPGAIGAGFDGGLAYDFWQGWMAGLSVRTIALSALNEDLFSETEVGLALAVSQKGLRKTLQSIGLYKDAKDGSENLGFSFALSSAEKVYRLSSDSPVGNNGYLGLVRSKAGLYVDYKPSDNFTLSVGPEYHYNRKYKIYTSTGSFRSSHNLDSTLGGIVRVLYKF